MDKKNTASKTLPAIDADQNTKNKGLKTPTLTFEKLFSFLKKLFKEEIDSDNNIYVKTINPFSYKVESILKIEINPVAKNPSICFIIMSDGIKSLRIIVTPHEEITNTTDAIGNTILHYAGYIGKRELFEFIVKEGGNLNTPNNTLLTPLHSSAFSSNQKLIEFILNNGGDINAVDNDGSTILHYAASFGNRKLCAFLLEQGANVNSCDLDGNTALHFAAQSADLKLIKLFLPFIENKYLQNKEGISPKDLLLTLTAKYKHPYITKQLIDVLFEQLKPNQQIEYGNQTLIDFNEVKKTENLSFSFLQELFTESSDITIKNAINLLEESDQTDYDDSVEIFNFL